jgi:hypothetical protein
MVDVVVPGAWSSVGLAATLASLASQRYPAFSVAFARPQGRSTASPVPDLCSILEARGHPVRIVDVPARLTPGGRRQALLDGATAPYVMVVEDDVFLEPDLLGRMVAAIRAMRCGLVGSAAIDLRYRDEHRPAEQAIEFWDGRVRPEEIAFGSRPWARRRLHRGANLEHLRQRLPRTRDRLYRIADVRGCVLYDAVELRAAGGFEDRRPSIAPVSVETSAQLRILARAGGAGLFPSGVYLLTPARTRPLRDRLVARPHHDRPVWKAGDRGTRWIRRGHLWRHGAAAAARLAQRRRTWVAP